MVNRVVGRRGKLLLTLFLISSGAPVLASSARADAVTSSFTFAASGDLGGDRDTAASLSALQAAGTDFFLALGDLSYSEIAPESAWCDFVKSGVGATYPFELVAGNHEDDGPDGVIDNFASCLPDRIGNTIGSYGKEYYFDYPPASPLARVISVSPGLVLGGTTWSYADGTDHQAWLSSAIDDARARSIPWVIVGMHMPCLGVGVHVGCEAGSALQNLLVRKRVDLVLQAHEHVYERGKQLALGSACTAIPVGSFNSGCVVDNGSDGSYVKGSGTVDVIAGAFGRSLVDVDTLDPLAGYWAALMGNNLNATYGFVRYQVTATQLTAAFVPSNSGGFTDSFTITAAGANIPPTASPASGVSSQGVPVSVTLTGQDPETCELGFSTAGAPTNGTLSQPSDQPCVPGSPNLDRAAVTYTPNPGFVGTDSFTFKVSDGTQFSTAATATVVVSAVAGGTLAFVPVADATVKQAYPGKNYGLATTLEVDSTLDERFLMKFSVAGVGGRAVTNARLMLYDISGSVRGGDVHRMADTTWGETTVTWDNAPSYDPGVVASLGAVKVGSWYGLDVTPVVTGDGTFSLLMASASTDGADYASAENSATLAPQLVVTLASGPALPALSINDASVVEGDAGSTLATFTVTLSVAATAPVTVNYATADGTASAPADYQSVTGTLVFDPGVTSRPVTVSVIGDTLDESDEAFFVNLSGASVAITDGQGRGAITDDDGSPAPATLTFTPSADATIKAGWPSKNYGLATTLEVDSTPDEAFLMKFSVAGLAGRPVTSAQLRLFDLSGSIRGGDIHRVADTTWSETAVTWNNAPQYDQPVVASLPVVKFSLWYSVDVASLITGDGTYSLRITSTSTDGADYASGQSDSTRVPQLVVTIG
jgi:Calx-beta domain-containing protein/calcineurin-like phosphoesterase family protein/Big-like domain-containing protein